MEYGATTAEKKKHLLVKSSSPLDIQQAYTYDSKGNVLTQQTQNSTASTFIKGATAYTADQNYVATQTDARGKVVTSTINPTTGTLTSVQDPNGQTVNYTYDSLKRVTGVQATAVAVNEQGNSVTRTYKNAYVYEDDKLTQVGHNTTSDANCDVQYNFAYDAAGKPTTVQVGTQTLSANTYNPDGTLSRVDYGNGDYVTYTYDDYKRLLGLRYKWDYEDRYAYSYGANGQVAQVQDNNLMRVAKSEYDTANRPMRIMHMNSETGDHIYTGEVQYDDYNNLKTFKEKVGVNRIAYQTDFTYDKENKPTLMTFGDANNKVAYAYDALGRMSTRTVTVGGVASASTYSYVAGGHGASSTSALVGAISQGNYENCSYTYDDVGNIIAATRGDQTTTYAYDNLGQLIRANDPFENATWLYYYDRGGNMTSKVRYAYTTGVVGTALQTILYDYGATWKDKLTAYNGVPITYDAIGNPLNDGTWNYTWNNGRQLRCIHKGEYGSAGYDENTYDYNADGLRTRKTRMYATASGDIGYESTEYTLHGKNIVHMVRGGNNLHFWYDAQNRPAMVEYNGVKYAYILNLQGDVVGIQNSAGMEVVRYTYDAWGKLLETTGSMAASLGYLNPFRYRGYVYDEETGLYYLRSRYYNPEWSRFVNADKVSLITNDISKIVGVNLFQYCINNPLIYTDQDGNIQGAINPQTSSYEVLAGIISFLGSIGPWGWIIAGIAIIAIVAIYFANAKIKNASKAHMQNLAELASYSNSTPPLPPDDPKSKGTKTNGSDTYYNKNGVRMDVENMGNTQGNVHIHVNGEKNKYLYDVVQKAFVDSSTKQLAPQTVQNLLNDEGIVKALLKCLKILGY